MAEIENNIIQGDSTTAFGQHLLRINLRDPDGLLENHSISKAEVRFACGIIKTFLNPTFPILVDLTEKESQLMLVGDNTASLAIWDENGEKLTPDGEQLIKVGARKV